MASKAFKTQDAFRAWLERHHASVVELELRLFKVHARHRGIGYRDALDEALCFGLRANRKAWAFWQSEPAGRRRVATFWVTQARKPETRERRFRVLLDHAKRGRPIPLIAPRR